MICKWFKSRKKKGYQSKINIYDWSRLEVDVLNLINKKLRTVYLTPDKNLYKGAGERVDYMLKVNHVSHDNCGVVWGKMDRLGLHPVGEVVQANIPNAETIVDLFIKSSTHKEELEKQSHKYIGVSIKKKTERMYVICAVLGRAKI